MTTSPIPPRRFRFGFIASSDNHFGRPGTGYKEVHRSGFTESRSAVGVMLRAIATMWRGRMSRPPRPPVPE